MNYKIKKHKNGYLVKKSLFGIFWRTAYILPRLKWEDEKI